MAGVSVGDPAVLKIFREEKSMKKKVLIWTMAFAAICVLSGTALAGSKGNQRKGKYIYRKVYKECHAAGKVDSPRPILSPDAKTQAQWKRVFDKKDFDQFGCPEQWSKLSEKELRDIFAYLYAHAADSPSPAKCK